MSAAPLIFFGYALRSSDYGRSVKDFPMLHALTCMLLVSYDTLYLCLLERTA